MEKLIRAVFGTKNSRELRRMGRVVAQINALEPRFEAMGDAELPAFTDSLRERNGNGEGLDALLPEAFAVVREAARRSKQMRHFDVQLIGGITLHEGRIAEMRTGEGKTLVATLPAYLNAIGDRGQCSPGHGQRLPRAAGTPTGWVRMYEALGHVRRCHPVRARIPAEKRTAPITADIIYGTNNEFGFDYLRDNMAFTLEDRFQRAELNVTPLSTRLTRYLIDEARTPLIISGAAERQHRPLPQA